MSDFYSEHERRAAKTYRCDECRTEILPGTRYVSWFQIFDGDAFGGHLCTFCRDLRAEAWIAFDWYGPEEAPDMGELRSYLRDEHGVTNAAAWYGKRVAAREAARNEKFRVDRAFATYQGAAE
jgi:hypothetical protein